ncbi:MAG TPA: glycosyltransferase [Polyangiaceae bacterium]|nr:glycosyltransferase [Polyangiaceae bacterium]
MRVVRVLPELDFGGVESRVSVQSMLHDRDAYELSVCAFHKDGAAARNIREQGLRVDVLGVSPAPRNPAAPLALARYLRRLKPDVVHASIAEANLHALVAGTLARVPVRIAEETGMPEHSRVARNVYRGVYQLASSVVGVSRAVCDYVRDVDNAPKDRVRLIYNCAGQRYFPEPRPELPERHGPTLTLLLVGRLVPVKNHLFFMGVLQRLLPEFPQVRVQIAGDGPLRAELARSVAGGLSAQVELLGARDDVPALLSRADVFALPSLSEGCSVSLIEAMASGAHAIGSDVAGIREVMGPLAAEWTAPPSDAGAWERLLRRTFSLGAAERLAVTRRAQARAYAEFSPRVYVATLETMYRELLAQRGRTFQRARVSLS